MLMSQDFLSLVKRTQEAKQGEYRITAMENSRTCPLSRTTKSNSWEEGRSPGFSWASFINLRTQPFILCHRLTTVLWTLKDK